MTSLSIHEALAQLRDIRGRIAESRLFGGYSAVARAAGGVLALAGAFIMSRPFFPPDPQAHACGWGMICALTVAVNFGAVLSWYLKKPAEQRHPIELKPVLDALPALICGGILTLVFLSGGHYEFLFGTWMCLFGLVNLAARHTQPAGILRVGWFYIAAGALVFLAGPALPFTNPWPMGIVFCAGEILGAMVFAETRAWEKGD